MLLFISCENGTVPDAEADTNTIRLDVYFLLDATGSMGGEINSSIIIKRETITKKFFIFNSLKS
jgi:hypothetical protein